MHLTEFLSHAVWQRLYRYATLFALLALAHAAPAADGVRIGGTGAALATMQALINELKRFEPGFMGIVVPNLGSGGALKAIGAGAIDIAITTRALNTEERALGLVGFEFAKTPFVLATSKTNPPNVDLRQLADIYSGRQSNWPDNAPIRLILRPASDSDSTYLGALSPEIKQALAKALGREGLIIASTDQDAANNLERLQGAVGTSTLSLIQSENRPLRMLSINGVIPSLATLADGSYPYAKSFHFVTAATPSAAMVRFAKFVRSGEGRRVLQQNGLSLLDSK